MTDIQCKEFRKAQMRLLKVLAKEIQKGVVFKNQDEQFLLLLGSKSFAFAVTVIRHCITQNLIYETDRRLFLTRDGDAHLKRALNPEEEFISQHATLAEKTIRIDGEFRRVTVNESESPLARLFTRRTGTGNPWLDEYEFQAGERLRADFEKSQLQPRISANWVESVASGGRAGNASAEISDFALDARKRVEAAIAVLGTDLADVAVDTCCFLKGLETIERERSWPPRSAKLMLRTALRVLVRHYGLSANRPKSTPRKPIGHWGADDFRPSV